MPTFSSESAGIISRVIKRLQCSLYRKGPCPICKETCRLIWVVAFH